MNIIEQNGYVFINNKKFKLLNKEGKSKYSTDNYIGKIFDSDLCLYYLGKNNKGQPFVIVECQLCFELREVNAYNLGLKTLKKCDCVSQRTSSSKKRESYSQYINKEIYGLNIVGLKQVGSRFYFQGLCEHGNPLEIEVNKFLEEKRYNCKCNSLRKNNLSSTYYLNENKRWFERLQEYKGVIVENKIIIKLNENKEDIDFSKVGAYRHYSFKTKCLDCGREVDIVAYDAYLRLMKPNKTQKRKLRTCICQRSIYMDNMFIGQIFGRLKVENIEYNKEKGEIYWHCECICKEKTKIRAVASTIYKGNRKSCGCLRRESIQNNSPYIDKKYIGQVFGVKNNEGGLKVLNIDLDSKESGIQWDCECLFCHDIVKLPAGQVVKGSLQSCGCHHTENTTFYKDRKFIGQKFNGIEVLDILENKGRGYSWKCKCPYCEKEFEELGSKIANNKKVSCGCQQGSFYEQYISHLLDKSKILYRREVRFQNLVGEKGQPLRYDFAIYSVDMDNILYLIEYDGQQHFDVNAQVKVKSLEEAVEKLKGIQRRDKMKNDYAYKHNIPLKRFNRDNRNEIETFILYLKNLIDK